MTINQSTSDFIKTHRNDDVRRLALMGSRPEGVDMALAVSQIAGWQKAREKMPSWAATDGIVYPQHLPLEQCSSEASAAYKASVIREFSEKHGVELESYADLTSGFGVDFTMIARLFKKATYIERQPELCEIARHNLPLLELGKASVMNCNGVEMLADMEPVSWLFLDPARRDENGGKTVMLKDCEPDVTLIEEQLLSKASHVMLKLSPMLDISLATSQLKHVQEIFVVSVENECKELLLILGKEQSDARITATNLSRKGNTTISFSPSEEQSASCQFAEEIAAGQWLYEPGSAVLKAGASRVLANRYNALKLHPNSNLFVSSSPIDEFPGRGFQIEFCCGFSKKEIKQHIAPLGKANLTIRNFPTSVKELRKKLKLQEGGETYLFATTNNRGEHIIIGCRKSAKSNF